MTKCIFFLKNAFRLCELERELSEEELSESLSEAETLKKAEKKLEDIKLGKDDHSPVVEEIGEALGGAKDVVKGVLGGVGESEKLPMLETNFNCGIF